MLTRLNGAHHALAHADKESTTVTDVAMGLGFTHLGRFSKAYKDLFGALPSDTLARRA
jgi:AraC-like DNA-binding protein